MLDIVLKGFLYLIYLFIIVVPRRVISLPTFRIYCSYQGISCCFRVTKVPRSDLASVIAFKVERILI